MTTVSSPVLILQAVDGDVCELRAVGRRKGGGAFKATDDAWETLHRTQLFIKHVNYRRCKLLNTVTGYGLINGLDAAFSNHCCLPEMFLVCPLQSLIKHIVSTLQPGSNEVNV